MAASTLPMDILVEEILPRLPTISLLRFKCVSKFFKSLISTPEFAHRHLRHSLSSDTSRLFVLLCKDGGLYTFHYNSTEFPALRLDFPNDFDAGLVDEFFVVGSSNGLACVGTPLPSLVIFNPSTGLYRKIHRESIYTRHSSSTYGFGFDDINHDYKIVKVTLNDVDNEGNDDPNYAQVWREVQVYSLKYDSWSLIETESFSQDLMEPMERSAVIDNHLVHWKFELLSDDKYRIACFDLRNNQWADDVPLPDFYPEDDTHSGATMFEAYRDKEIDLLYLGVVDGCLCLLTKDFRRDTTDVWVMKEYGVKDSWDKLLSFQRISILKCLKVFPFLCGNGSRTNNLTGLGLESKLVELFRWVENDGVPRYSKACMCNGSLVRIPGGVSCQIQALKDEEEQTMQA